MTFDPTKPVRTRDGRPARVICANCIGEVPIMALVLHQGTEHAIWYDAEGLVRGARVAGPDDLVNTEGAAL